jgi:DNA (cytosine-5)-methyltransferase 1
MLAPTIVAGNDYIHFNQYKLLNRSEICQIGSYPLDYDFNGIEAKYLIGMSVPPVMTAQIANQINIQWLSKIKTNSIIYNDITTTIG